MSFAIFGALVLWFILWLAFPRASFVVLLVMWLNLAHPSWSKQVMDPITLGGAFFGIIVGIVLDILQHRSSKYYLDRN